MVNFDKDTVRSMIESYLYDNIEGRDPKNLEGFYVQP